MDILCKLIESQKEFALLEDTKSPQQSHDLFTEAFAHIIVHHPSELKEAFAQIESLSHKGFHLCGYVAYEAGYSFIDKTMELAHSQNDILLYFIAFKNKQTYQPQDYQEKPLALYNFNLSQSRSDYIKAISQIKNHIEQGDSYQVNYTLKYDFSFTGDILSLYRHIQQNQPVEYGALLHFEHKKILSFSPELFVKKTGKTIISQPMKGTAKRGKNAKEDQKIIKAMQKDEKTLAENLMIVDLMRNDLSRLCQIGSVKVKNLFEIKSYKSLHQMVSTIYGELKPHIGLFDIFKNIFPCGSITGAPKIKTMEIISALETRPRNVYTGALGYLSPQQDFCFNIPIRSVLITGENKAEMGIGSGIVYDSLAKDEYEECLLKAQFLKQANRSFHLFETMRADEGNIALLSYHLERLQKSAAFFGFSFNIEEIEEILKPYIKELKYLQRVKLCLYHDGKIKITHSAFQDDKQKIKLVLSSQAINHHDIWLYHKTSQRHIYEQEYEKALEQGYGEVVFVNEKGEITEASRHNIFIKQNGKLYTPPVHCGLLPGVFRQKWLDDKKAEEKILTKDDLYHAEALYISNGLRLMREAEI